MMNLNEAIAYGKRIGVRYYIRNQHGCIVGGAKTLETARNMVNEMKSHEFEKSFYGEVHIETTEGERV